MKVLHIVTAFPRHDGDVITPWLGRLLLELRRTGIDARVLAPAYQGGGATEWRGIPVRRFRYAPSRLETLTHDEATPDRLHAQPTYAALLPGYMLGGSIASWSLGRADPPDVVHVHWPLPHAWFGAAVRAASGGHTAMVSTFHSVEVRWVENKLRWVKPFLRWSTRMSDTVTANSNATAAAVERYTNRPVPVIPFSAAVSGPRRTAYSSAVALPSPARGSLRLLFVGRLVERKGVHILIRALAQVRNRVEATLTVIGDGPWRERLELEAARIGVEEFVDFRGHVDEASLAEAYGTSDIFVLPAVVDQKGDTEGLGVVLLEAMESGLPVIASDTGGIPDIVVHDKTGLLVPSGDPDALCRAILTVVEHPGAARDRAERGKARVRKRFALSCVVDRVIRCYEEAIATRRSHLRTAQV